MRTTRPILALLCWVLATAAGATPYVPPPGEWATRTPAEAGFDPGKLAAAVAFAQASETPITEKTEDAIRFFLLREPHNEIIGPVKDRGAQNGMLLRDGYIVAEWGDTRRVDMTFSVTKSYLSTVAGLAWDDGLIRDVHDPVRDYVRDGGFDSDHNRPITWHMLLNQTSGWQGTLWGKPDWADRFRGERPPVHAPGTHWRYNDVRVNRLALALLQVWRRPLPQVLRTRIMDPIGASPTWRWHGYENSWVVIDGQRMQSVAGGAHWGGGLFISTRDHARFALLYLRRGNWGGAQLLSEAWVARALTPTPQEPTYGYMNWLPNTDRGRYASAPETSFFAHGAGSNVFWCDPEHNIVAVLRWIREDRVDTFIAQVLAALNGSGPGPGTAQ